MTYVSGNDKYQIKLASIITNVDKDVLVELYQPLVGATAIMLYLTLQKQNRNGSIDEQFSVDQLISITQYSPSIILSARHMLEAVGLLRTYENAIGEDRYYIFVLYAPKSPKDFFDDVLFKGLLFQYIGEKEVKKLASRYKIDLSIPEGYNEVSASFVEVYHPNYDDPAFRKEISGTILGHDAGRVKINFNYDLFYKNVSDNSQIDVSSLTKKDMKEIERLSALFGLDEKQISLIVISHFDSLAHPHIDFDKVASDAMDAIKYKSVINQSTSKSKVSGEGILVEKVKLMDESTPAYFLQVLQNNTKPARADLKIVDELSKEYGFSNGVINVIIDYVLNKNNNILSRNYCEKIASSLARQKVETTIDAMNYLNRQSSSSITKKTLHSKNLNENKTENKKKVLVSDDEMNEIFKMLDSKKKGGK